MTDRFTEKAVQIFKDEWNNGRPNITGKGLDILAQALREQEAQIVAMLRRGDFWTVTQKLDDLAQPGFVLDLAADAIERGEYE